MIKDDDQVEEYRPTKNEQKLLEVMLNPDHRFLTIQKQCQLAGVDRSVHYRAFRKKEFVELYREESRALTVRALARVVNACVDEAVRGSAQHAKIVLGMAGEYSEKQDVRILDKNGVPQNLGGLSQMTDDEIEDELRRYESIRKATQA